MQTETKAIEEHIIRALFSDPDIFSLGLNDPTLLLLDFSLFALEEGITSFHLFYFTTFRYSK